MGGAFAGREVAVFQVESSINYAFISELEGGQVLVGDVPDPHHSNSGVTIATGFDIGQRSPDEIDAMDIPQDLRERLKPYAGIMGQAALDALSANGGLIITRDEADAIDMAVKTQAYSLLVQGYDSESPGLLFCQLPEPAQTVIASVAFQYGDLAIRTPRFWSFVIVQDWAGAIDELRNFGDRYQSRREREADYLEQIWL